MSFDAFMKGFQGGMGTMQDARRARQMDKIYDAAIRDIEDGETADEAMRGERGLTGSDWSMPDPFLFRLKDMFSRRGRAKPPGAGMSALPITDENTFDTTPMGAPRGNMLAGTELPAYDFQQYADGGLTEKELAERNRARSPGRVESSTQSVRGADRTAKPAPKPQAKTGKLAGAARSVLPVAVGAAAVQSLGENTEDQAAAMGIDNYQPLPDEVRLPGLAGLMPGGVASDVGVRTARTMQNVGNAVTFGLADKVGRSIAPDSAPKQAVPTPTVPEPSRLRTGTGRGGSGVSVSSAAQPAAAVPTAVPAAAPEDPENMSFNGMDPIEVPDFKTTDWAAYREKMLDDLVQRGGISRVDAFEKVDQHVIGMQMRGFSNFVNQGMALQAAGDVKGASAAYRAGFQYFPSTTDVKFATIKGQLVGYGVDEDTGEPVGKPWVVNPETLSVAVKNFSSPGAWAAHAQDRQQSARQDRMVGIAQGGLDLQRDRLNKVEIPQAQAMADTRAITAEAAMARASGAGGMSGSEALAADKDVREVLDGLANSVGADGELAYPQLQSPQTRNAFVSAVQQLKRTTGWSTESVLQFILSQVSSGK